MATFQQLQRAPDRTILDRLAEAVRPGARVVRVQRLVGGIDNGLHRLRLEHRDGRRENVLLRRYGKWEGAASPSEQARTEWQTLHLLRECGVPAPKPILEDANGELAGNAAIVTSFLPGKPQLTPDHPTRWPSELATALARLHRATQDADPRLHYLRDARAEWERLAAMAEAPAHLARHPDGEEMWTALRANVAVLKDGWSRLIHYDYWPGNTIWSRGRLTGMIDWGSAARGEPAYDVAFARLDLSITGHPETADRFLEVYQREAGRRLPDLPFYELLASLRAAPDPAAWIAGWNDLGAGPYSADEVRRNYRNKIREVLSALK